MSRQLKRRTGVDTVIIVGEKLNSSVPATLKAFNEGDEGYLGELIKCQQQGGADFLDINTSICGENELEKMLWAISLVKEHSNCGIMIDSPSPAVVKRAIEECGGRDVIINSVTLYDRFEELAPVAKEKGAGLVCLPIGKSGVPESLEERVDNVKALVSKAKGFGLDLGKVYIDVLVQALSVGDNNGKVALDTIRATKRLFPEVKTIGGISNVSFGLPKRKFVNMAFLAAAVEAGIDSCIMDVTSLDMRAVMAAATAVAGRDEFCLGYIDFTRGIE